MWAEPNAAVTMSPSSRRAWIEITMAYTRQGTVIVALLAEGVDRNFCTKASRGRSRSVALLAEGVDRNRERRRRQQ